MIPLRARRQSPVRQFDSCHLMACLSLLEERLCYHTYLGDLICIRRCYQLTRQPHAGAGPPREFCQPSVCLPPGHVRAELKCMFFKFSTAKSSNCGRSFRFQLRSFFSFRSFAASGPLIYKLSSCHGDQGLLNFQLITNVNHTSVL
jgi:hypothetical protein